MLGAAVVVLDIVVEDLCAAEECVGCLGLVVGLCRLGEGEALEEGLDGPHLVGGVTLCDVLFEVVDLGVGGVGVEGVAGEHFG